MKCPQINFAHLPSDNAVKSGISQYDAIIIKNCMKQHLMVLALSEPVFCKEYLCLCNSYLRFDFKECLGDDIPVYAELPCNDYFGEYKEVDAINTQQKVNF